MVNTLNVMTPTQLAVSAPDASDTGVTKSRPDQWCRPRPDGAGAGQGTQGQSPPRGAPGLGLPSSVGFGSWLR